MRELLKCHAGTKVPANPTLPAPALDVLYHPPNNDASLKKTLYRVIQKVCQQIRVVIKDI